MLHCSQDLRVEKLGLRDGLAGDIRLAKSEQITRNLASILAYRQAKAILYFVNFRSEVITTPDIQGALDEGKNVCLPLTVVRPKMLIAYQIRNLATDLQSGYQDIPEPNPDKAVEFDPARLDVVIVPGSVFDKRGGRMGYGGGYYDRFLANMAPQATRIGVCFGVQLEDKIPLEPHDELLDFVVSEDGVYECFRGKGC